MTSLVERVSRFTMFLRNNDRQSQSSLKGLIYALGPLRKVLAPVAAIALEMSKFRTHIKQDQAKQ